MRAHELGQPLTCSEMGCGRSMPARRSSSCSTAAAAFTLVSTIASLQNSMPVQAIVLRRNRSGREDSPSASSPAMSEGTRSSGMSRITSFWCGVVRSRADPCSSMRSDSFASDGPEIRPTSGVTPT